MQTQTSLTPQNWLNQQVTLLEELDNTWRLINETVHKKIREGTRQQKQYLSCWFIQILHIYEELKTQQNWEPSSKIRKKILRLLRRCGLLKPQYPAFSFIWSSNDVSLPIGSSIRCPTIYGFDLYLSGSDLWSVIATGYYKQELSETFLLLQLLPQMEVFIDVGANIGFYSLLAAKTCHNCSIFAFEPESKNFDKIQQAIRANNLEEKITLFHMAIGSNSQKTKLYHCPLGSGGHSVSPSVPFSDPRSIHEEKECEIVDSITLDDVQKKYFPHFPRTLIKIDVEGHEHETIKGAKNWLSSPTAPTILLEAVPRTAYSNKSHVLVINELKKNGYKIYPVLQAKNGAILGSEIRLINNKSPSDNYLALPPHSHSLLNSIQFTMDTRVFTQTKHIQSLLAFLKGSLQVLVDG